MNSWTAWAKPCTMATIILLIVRRIICLIIVISLTNYSEAIQYNSIMPNYKCIMRKRKSILLRYSTVLQHFNGVHDLCNDIHIQSDFTGCPTSYTQQLQQPALVLNCTWGSATCTQTADNEASNMHITKVMNLIVLLHSPIMK